MGPLAIGQSRPLRESSLRGFDGPHRHAAIAVGDARPNGTIGRVEVVKCGTRRNPRPANEEIVEGSRHLSLPCFHQRAVLVALEHLDLGLAEHRNFWKTVRLAAMRNGVL